MTNDLNNFIKCLIFLKTQIKFAIFNSVNQYFNFVDKINRLKNIINFIVYRDE